MYCFSYHTLTESYTMPSQRRGLNPSPTLTDGFADDSGTIERILDHRASVREVGVLRVLTLLCEIDNHKFNGSKGEGIPP